MLLSPITLNAYLRRRMHRLFFYYLSNVYFWSMLTFRKELILLSTSILLTRLTNTLSNRSQYSFEINDDGVYNLKTNKQTNKQPNKQTTYTIYSINTSSGGATVRIYKPNKPSYSIHYQIKSECNKHILRRQKLW